MREFTGYKKGVDLGGWLSQCGEGNYTKERFDTFITEKDIERIASWGADHVRLPIDYNVIRNEDGSFKENGFKYIDMCIEWCRKNDLKIVLDLHKTAGYVFDDKEYCQFFREKSLQDYFVSLWEEIIRRYGKYSDFIAFELLNEITDPNTAEIWNDIAERTTAAIRKLNKNAKIIIGGIFNSSIYGLTLLRKPADENIIFTFHCYSPIIFTHQSAYWVENMPLDYKISYPEKISKYRDESEKYFGDSFKSEFAFDDGQNIDTRFFERLFESAVKVSEKYDVPLYCGEYGVIDRADAEDAANWFRDINAAFEKYNISRAVWNYKEMDFGLTDEHLAPMFDEIIKIL